MHDYIDPLHLPRRNREREREVEREREREREREIMHNYTEHLCRQRLMWNIVYSCQMKMRLNE